MSKPSEWFVKYVKPFVEPEVGVPEVVSEIMQCVLSHAKPLHDKMMFSESVLCELMPPEKLRVYRVFILNDNEVLDTRTLPEGDYYVFSGKVLAYGFDKKGYFFNTVIVEGENFEFEAFEAASVRCVANRATGVLHNHAQLFGDLNTEVQFELHDSAMLKASAAFGECHDESFAYIDGSGLVKMFDHSAAVLKDQAVAEFHDRSFGIGFDHAEFSGFKGDSWALAVGTDVQADWRERAHYGEPIVRAEQVHLMRSKADFLFQQEDKEEFLRPHFAPQQEFDLQECPIYFEGGSGVLPIHEHPMECPTYNDPHPFFPDRCENVIVGEFGLDFEIDNMVKGECYFNSLCRFTLEYANTRFDPCVDPAMFIVKEFRCAVFTEEESAIIRKLNRQLWSFFARPYVDEEGNGEEVELDEFDRLKVDMTQPLSDEDLNEDNYDLSDFHEWIYDRQNYMMDVVNSE